MDSDLSLVIATFLGASAALIIGLVTIFYTRKENNRTATISIFKILNSNLHKKSENDLRKFSMKHFPDFPKNSADVVSRNYDQVGLMIKNGLVPPKDYYFMYGGVTMTSFVILRSWIDNENIENPHFRVYFRNLAKDCYDELSRRNIPIPHPSENRRINYGDIF